MTSDVAAHLEKIASARRREDAGTLLELMRRVTGQEPRLWGSIVGFGQYHYRYASGREGDAAAASFAARKGALTIYLPDGVDVHGDLLARLGAHTTGVGCLYIKELNDVDLDVLQALIARSYANVDAGLTRGADAS